MLQGHARSQADAPVSVHPPGSSVPAFDFVVIGQAVAISQRRAQSPPTWIPYEHPDWLGFLDTFRTFWLTPLPEIISLLEELKAKNEAQSPVLRPSRVPFNGVCRLG
jgi:hypothetical protein